MAQKQHMAQYAFFYFLALVALHITAINVGVIIFALINLWIPDVGSYVGDINGAFKFGISSLLIASPVYFFMTYKINTALAKEELSNDAGVRKWLSYLILFIASVVIIGQAIAVLFGYFDGELTTRFLLKALTVLILSGVTFSYYLYDVKRKDVKKKDSVIQTYFIVSAIIVVAALILGFMNVESPQMTRERNLDNERVENLSSIEFAVEEYYRVNQTLPQSLDDITEKKSEGFYLSLEESQDPETQQPYEYQVLEEAKYELCAIFTTSNTDEEYPIRKQYIHDVGRQCFTRVIPEYVIKENVIIR